MITGSRQQLEGVSVAELSVADISVAPASTARNLGVLFDRSHVLVMGPVNYCNSLLHCLS